MAAPATSSTSSLVPFFLSSMDSRSVEMKKLLSITSKDLEKNGFEAKIWLNYFEHTYRPEFLARVKSAIQQDKSSQNLEKIEARTRRFEQVFKHALEKLQQLPSNKKAWKNYPGEIEKTIHLIFQLVAQTEAVFFGMQAPLAEISELEEAVQKYTENDEIHAAVCNHLIHLLIDRIRLELNPNNENCFVLQMDENPKIALEENGIWRLIPILDPKDTSLKFHIWSAVPNPSPANSSGIKGMETHAILTKGTEIISKVPFIGISFQLHPASPEVQKALATHAPLQITDQKAPCMIDAVYCSGIPKQSGRGNALFFAAVSNFTQIDSPIWSNEKLENPSLWEYTQMAIQSMKKIWLEEIQKNPIEKFNFDYIYFPPTTPEEADEKMIQALEAALESPEENALLIEWIADRYDFVYSTEELDQAEQLAAVPIVLVEEEQKKTEEITVAPAVLAHAVIQKLKKPKLAEQRPAAQRPKERPIKAASSAASSSSKRQTLSKEELAEQLGSSSMPPKLKEKAVGILSGKKLINKREVDKFFLEIVSFQAQASGSQVQKGNKGGSHHSIKLVKQTDESGKITYRAATLVNKHGRDPNRAASLRVQQSNLLSLFTPLG